MDPARKTTVLYNPAVFRFVDLPGCRLPNTPVTWNRTSLVNGTDYQTWSFATRVSPGFRRHDPQPVCGGKKLKIKCTSFCQTLGQGFRPKTVSATKGHRAVCLPPDAIKIHPVFHEEVQRGWENLSVARAKPPRDWLTKHNRNPPKHTRQTNDPNAKRCIFDSSSRELPVRISIWTFACNFTLNQHKTASKSVSCPK